MITGLIVFIIVLGAIVVVHELGHFIAARLFGVGVDEFGLGYPPRLLGKRFGQTVYSLNWIPIGGFVKVKGFMAKRATGKTVTTSDSFADRPIWQRASIIVAGIVMNIVLAWLLFTIGYLIGLPTALTDLPAGASVTDQQVIVAQLDATVPAAKQGLQVGDSLISLNGQTVTSLADVRQQVQDWPLNQTISVTVQQPHQTQRDLQLNLMPLQNGSQGIGAFFLEQGIVRLPLLSAISYAAQQTIWLLGQIIIGLYSIIVQLVTGGGVSSSVAGPVGIASLTSQATSLGFSYVLEFAAMLSLNLAVFNVLPIPLLDGGRLLFIVLEAIRRKPVDQRLEVIVHNIGFIALLGLILAVTIKDIINLF